MAKPPAGDDLASVAGGHAGAEAVAAFAHESRGLERTLHDRTPVELRRAGIGDTRASVNVRRRAPRAPRPPNPAE